MHYVYLLKSKKRPEKRYVGMTGDLRERLKLHNRGECVSTKAWASWLVETYIAFTNFEKAVAFERYLKTGSGFALARRRFG